MADDGEKGGQGGTEDEVRRRGGQNHAPWNVGNWDALDNRGTEEDTGRYCGRSFQRVQQQGEDAEQWRFAGYVGCADVAAAGAPDVFAAEDADQKIAERDRAQ